MQCWSARRKGFFVLSRSAWLYPLVVGNTSTCVTAAVFVVVSAITAPLPLLATGGPSIVSPSLAAGSTLQPAASPDTSDKYARWPRNGTPGSRFRSGRSRIFGRASLGFIMSVKLKIRLLLLFVIGSAPLIHSVSTCKSATYSLAS